MSREIHVPESSLWESSRRSYTSGASDYDLQELKRELLAGYLAEPKPYGWKFPSGYEAILHDLGADRGQLLVDMLIAEERKLGKDYQSYLDQSLIVPVINRLRLEEFDRLILDYRQCEQVFTAANGLKGPEGSQIPVHILFHNNFIAGVGERAENCDLLIRGGGQLSAGHHAVNAAFRFDRPQTYNLMGLDAIDTSFYFDYIGGYRIRPRDFGQWDVSFSGYSSPTGMGHGLGETIHLYIRDAEDTSKWFEVIPPERR